MGGFTRLLNIIDETTGSASAWNTPIYVQGDIQPIIPVLAHHGRQRRLDILRILELVRYGAAPVSKEPSLELIQELFCLCNLQAVGIHA